MSLPKPIRYDIDTWLCMRNDPALPKAIIRRDHTYRDSKITDIYRVFRWDLDPAQRIQVSGHWTLDEANRSVLFESAEQKAPQGGINGQNTPTGNANHR